jgi:hypothetical protein
LRPVVDDMQRPLPKTAAKPDATPGRGSPGNATRRLRHAAAERAPDGIVYPTRSQANHGPWGPGNDGE